MLFGLLLSTAGCAAATPEHAVAQALSAGLPVYSGTIIAVRPEASYPDPTGALYQIMSILGQPVPRAVSASEIVIRMPGDTIKANVQPPAAAQLVGAKATLITTSMALIQPY